MSRISETAPWLTATAGTDQKTAPAPPAPRSLRSGPRVLSWEEGYELWAPAYDRDPNPLLALEERTLKPLLPDLAGQRVLDLGSGTGRWLELLLDLGARRAVGVDRSPAMLRVAATKARLCSRLVKGDCLAIPFRSGAADVVVCSFALGHISKLEAFAGEVARVAKPQADIWLTDLHPEGYARGWRVGFRQGSGPREIATFAYSVEQVRQAFRSQCLEMVESIEPHLGEPERVIFSRAGRADLFDDACKVPAVLICHFRRSGPRIGAKEAC